MPKAIPPRQPGPPKTREDHNMQALWDTLLDKMDTEEKRQAYRNKALSNHARWKNQAKPIAAKVRVLSGDWGDVTKSLSEANGAIYAVLNMANAYSPGGGYLQGMIAQEENMFRRTDCHFYVKDEHLDANKKYYKKEVTDLINAEKDRVYLDVEHPRICIKGNEAEGYKDLADADCFLFYELKAAADDLRGGKPFDEKSMRKKIKAQFETLKEKGIRHVVLSAFGCGAFNNPAEKVAAIYREELALHLEHFDEVIFSVFHAGYGAQNYPAFIEAFKNFPGAPNASPNKPAAPPPPPANQQPNLEQFISGLESMLKDTQWDKAGYVLPFFDFRKTPTGIVELRKVADTGLSAAEKLTKLQEIADYRLKHPPRFTDRLEVVEKLYTKILAINPLKLQTVADMPVPSEVALGLA